MNLRHLHYDRYLETDPARRVGVRDRSFDDILQLVERFADASVEAPLLEIGCGTGHLLLAMKKRGLEVYGVDLSPMSVAAARDLGLDAFNEPLATHLSAKASSSIGGIVAVDVLEHLTPEELQDLALQAARTIIPGGALIAQTVNGGGLFSGQVFHSDITHQVALTPRSFRQVFALAGFRHFEFFEVLPARSSTTALIRRNAWKATLRCIDALATVESGRSPDRLWSRNMLVVASL